MKKGGSKQKGSAFERLICKELSLWWSNDKKEDVFWLTSGSGARATMRTYKNKSTANSAGDICYLDELGKPFCDYFLCEIKKGYNKKLSVLSILDSDQKEPLLIKWILKAEQEKRKHKRQQILIIFKRDYKNTCIAVSDSFMMEIERHHDVYRKPIISLTNFRRKYRLSDNYIVVDYGDFFHWFRPEIMWDFLNI